MNLPLDGEKWILSVAQKPFYTNGNEFCTLAPLVSDEGRRAKPELFPNTGRVWWLLRGGYRTWAQPGRLVIATLEPSVMFERGDPNKHLYQAQVDAVTPVTVRDAVEILTVRDPQIRRPEDLVDRPDLLRLDHHPADSVWVRVADAIYGPFKTSVNVQSDSEFDVGFTVPQHNPTVHRVPDTALGQLGTGYCKSISAQISRTASARPAESSSQGVLYELVIGDTIEQLSNLGEPIALETDDRVITRAAKQVLPRKRRQELSGLLKELEALVSSSAEAADAAAVVQAIQRRFKTNSEAVDELVERLFQTGVLEKKLDQRLDAALQAEVQKQASYLMAEAERQTLETQRRLATLRSELLGVEEDLRQRREDARAGLDREIDARRRDLEAAWQAREERLTERETNLEDRESRLRSALEDAARRLDEKRGEVITDVLTVLPLLSALPSALFSTQAQTTPPDPPDVTRHGFELPSFTRAERPAAFRTPLREDEFFSRFARRVRDAGFAYDDDDLIALHLSVKSSDLTLLSGVSGTGKSSLPRFYMEAVQGEDASELDGDIGRYLHVAVRPSWLDQQDLLGHVNTLDHEFMPSESGLFPLLAAAADEYRRRGADTGLYLICLDEMNLAQVEHYFASFLSALERPENERRIRCFDPNSVSFDSPFRIWSQLPLPASLHFVGTVNYDETTRPLSLRFLDRTDEIELATQDFHTLRSAARGAQPERAVVPGRPVTLRDMRSWVREDALSPELAAVLDVLREPLRKMRRPLTPRRYEALTRFVAGAAGLGDLCPPEKAFDLQLSLRLVPQLRNLSSPDARDGLGDLLDAFKGEGYDTRLPRTWSSLQTVEEMLRPILEIG